MTIEKLEIYENLADCKESMCHDSGKCIASATVRLDDGNFAQFDLEVRGYVDISVLRPDGWSDEYRHASDMPKELIDKFRDGSAWTDEKIVIEENNWFEMLYSTVCATDNTYIAWDGIVVEEDFSGFDEEQMKKLFLEYASCIYRNVA